jgi:IstB-like ATP binding protein
LWRRAAEVGVTADAAPGQAHGRTRSFSLVSSRYERASMIVTSNKPFSAWGELALDPPQGSLQSLACPVGAAGFEPATSRV